MNGPQICVLGMHRSGTSALTRVLELMGCHLGAPEELAAPDAANPRGYFERRDVWALNELVLERLGASWHDVTHFDGATLPDDVQALFSERAPALIAGLDRFRPWAAKDPRLCLLFPLWRAHLERPVCVLVHRDPLEIARSLKKRDGFPLAAGLALWERYTRDALRFSAGLPRALVSYHDLLARPEATAARLLEDLDRQGAAGGLACPPAGALHAFLDAELHRQRARSGAAFSFLAPEQRELLERVGGTSALSDARLPPASVAGADALESLAEERRRERAGVELLERMIQEKDRFTTALLEQRKALEHDLAHARAAGGAGTGEPRPAGAAPDWSGWGVCTIVSRNYLSLARACCRSFLRHHPGARAYVLLVDAREGVDAASEPFELLAAGELGIPDFEDFAFKYNILELNTAVKPRFLSRLLERGELTRLVYLDPDVYVYGPFDELRDALETHAIALTPHALAPLPEDGRRPTEHDFLVSGAYNLGFIALAPGDEAARLLEWWRHKLHDGAFSDAARGLFTDQKWMDLVPGYFDGTAVLRQPGYNVAYWNLHERNDLAAHVGTGYTVCGAPLRFFHFSGFDKRQPARLSKHQDRFTLGAVGPHLRTLFAEYSRALDENGWGETCALPYAYGFFDNGARVPDLARRLWHELGPARQRFGNPFHAAGARSFFHWLTVPETDQALSPLLRAMRTCRPDLVDAFPDPEGADLERYLEWVLAHHEADFGLAEPYTTIFRSAREAVRGRAGAKPPAAVAPAALSPAGPAEPPEGPPATRLKRVVAALVGDQRYRALRREVVWPLYARLRRRPRQAAEAALADDGRVSRPRAARAAAAREVPRPFGVNLIGYLDTESGVGETARGYAALLQAGGIPHALLNLHQPWLRRGDRRLAGFTHARPYAVDLFVVNADQLPGIYRQLGVRRGEAYDVSVWGWELSHFPRGRFGEALGLVDEIWTYSDFCRAAFSSAATVPVHKVAPPLVFEAPREATRAEFGLDEAFTFLFVYDAASIVKRKNPGAAVAAFRRAFPGSEPVQLVLKTTHVHGRHADALQRLARGARVRVVDGYLSRDRLVRLLAASDAYVSLHRSEGLGLTLLEALMLGKPVVATPYSGVTEFLNGPGAFPVAYTERRLVRDHGPYPRGAVWAEPDVADAARQMRRAYEAWRDPDRRPHDVGAWQRQRYGVAGTLPEFLARLDAIRSWLAAPSLLTPPSAASLAPQPPR